MAECSKCGEKTSMPFSCKFCGESFCSNHRLPENHDCGGLEGYKEEKRQESQEITYDAEREEEAYRGQVGTKASGGITNTFRKWKRKISSFFNQGRSPRGVPQRRQPRRSHVGGAMRQSFPEVATFTLLALVAVGFILQIAIDGFTGQFALVPSKVMQEPWRIVTSMFLHGGTGHLLVNSLVLFFFGAELERRIGTKRFLKLFFLAGIVAGVGFTGYIQFFGCNAPGGTCSAVGASGALYGVFATLAIIAPEITVLAFFIIPMRIRVALVGFALLDIFLLTSGGTLIASSAHLTGMVVGLYYGFKLERRLKNTFDVTMF